MSSTENESPPNVSPTSSLDVFTPIGATNFPPLTSSYFCNWLFALWLGNAWLGWARTY